MATTPLGIQYPGAGEVVNGMLNQRFRELAETADTAIGGGGGGGGSVADWSPTYTNITVGNGVVRARWVQIGPMVAWSLSLIFGSTTSVTGTMQVNNLPVTPAGPGWTILGNGYLNDASSAANRTMCFARHVPPDTTAFNIFLPGGSANATSPFTWAVDDRIEITGQYLTS